MPPAQVRWRTVLLAGFASALTVACLSWLFDPSRLVDAPIEAGAVLHADTGSAALATRRPALSPTLRPGQVAPATLQSDTTTLDGASASDAAISVPSSTPPQAMIGLLTQRGDAALAVGDIIAARMLYERAAGMGSATAATAAGKTYDLDFLIRADTHGIRPDPASAATWYRKAVALGDPSARGLLGRLEAKNRP
jgi:hypothetical protein